MSIRPENIEPGRCYLARGKLDMGGNGLRVRRVIEILPDGQVRYEQRRGPLSPGHPRPNRGRMGLQAFAARVMREVPCNWAVESGDAG